MVHQIGMIETPTGEGACAFTLRRAHVAEIFEFASRALPEECCGLIGGQAGFSASIYPLANRASNPQMRYEADLQELLQAQKQLRVRREELLGIYHSHPRAADPEPSETDVRLAYYPQVIYFIVGFRSARRPVLRAFRIYADEGRWEEAAFRVE